MVLNLRSFFKFFRLPSWWSQPLLENFNLNNLTHLFLSILTGFTRLTYFKMQQNTDMKLFPFLSRPPANTYALQDTEHRYPLDVFVTSVNTEVNRLNEWVKAFNNTEEKKKKVELLLEIHRYYLHILTKYPEGIISSTPEFIRVFQEEGFNNIKKAFNQQGLQSIDNLSLEAFDEEQNQANENTNSKKITLTQIFKSEAQQEIGTLLQSILGDLYPKDFNEPIENVKFIEKKYNELKALKKTIRYHIVINPQITDRQKIILREQIQSINTLLKDYETTLFSVNLHPVTDCSALNVLANMSPSKLNDFAEVLATGASFHPSVLNYIYSKGEDGYDSYQFFILSHHITFLGGGNTKLFLLSTPENKPCFILKLEKRFDAPKDLEITLEEGVLHEIIPPMEFRQTTIQHPFSQNDKGPITTYLTLTSYCNQGNLLMVRSCLLLTDEIQISAAKIYYQMAQLFTILSQHGIAFVDPKNTNWLLNQNKLKISDTKSFLPAAHGRLNWKSKEIIWFPNQKRVIHSTYPLPPELIQAAKRLENNNEIDVDKMHAFCLGINLYEFLTLCDDPNRLEGKIDGGTLDFTDPIFSLPNGGAFQRLIQRLVKANPEDRISTENAAAALREIIRLDPLKRTCTELLKLIYKYRFSNQPDRNYYASKSQDISTGDYLHLVALSKELQHLLSQLAQQYKTEAISYLKQIENYYFDNYQHNLNLNSLWVSLNQGPDIDSLNRIYQSLTKQMSLLVQKCLEILNILENQHCIGGSLDGKMAQFISSKKIILSKPIHELPDLVSLRTEIQQVYLSVTSPQMKIIQESVGDLSQKLKTKIQKRFDIESALREVPILRRRDAFFENSVQHALARQRGPIHKGVPVNPDGTIKEDKAANSFKTVKKRVQELNQIIQIQDSQPKAFTP